MRALAPIRVRKCDCDYCNYFEKHCAWVCRICGAETPAYDWADAMEFGLRHLRNAHPWPWAPAQLDIRDGSNWCR